MADGSAFEYTSLVEETGGQPQIKATQVKVSLTIAERLAGERVQELHEAIGAESLALIRDAIGTSWIPLDVDIVLSHAVEATCGPRSDFERARQSLTASMDQKLLRPFIEGVRKVFGLSPKGMLKTSRRGWSSLYRDGGKPEFVDLGANAAALDFVEMPDAVLASEVYLRAISGAFHALLDLCGVQGEVFVEALDPRARTVRFRLTWQ
ncbi:MAG: hypothetical protein ACRBN8_18605 [Nannocystales bacterium]